MINQIFYVEIIQSRNSSRDETIQGNTVHRKEHGMYLVRDIIIKYKMEKDVNPGL